MGVKKEYISPQINRFNRTGRDYEGHGEKYFRKENPSVPLCAL